MPKKSKFIWTIEVGGSCAFEGIFSSKRKALDSIETMFFGSDWDTSDLNKQRPLDGKFAFVHIRHLNSGTNILITVSRVLINNGTQMFIRAQDLVGEEA